MSCYAFILFLTFLNSIQIYAACPLGYAESNDPTKCYRLVAGPVNFFDAESNCARSATNGHLLSISNSFVNSFIAESTKSMMLDSSLQVFIGGYLNGSSWTWSDGSPFVYNRWAKGQPNGNGSCIGLNPRDEYWYSLSCDMLIPFYICEAVSSTPVTLACDPEWTYFNNSCYKVFHNANWTSAQDFCMKNGSNLTSIHSLEENQFLIALTKMGHDIGTTNTWYLNIIFANMDSQTNGHANNSQPNTSKATTSEVVVAMPLLQQTGKVVVGPGAQREAMTIGLGLTKLRSWQKDDLERAKRYAMEQSIKHVLLKQQISHQQHQQKIAMYAQALSLMARIYVGSISFEIREPNIRETFGVFGPIKSINMSYDAVTGHHKGFAFIEYEVPEAAKLSEEAMNGIFMGGRNIKVMPVGRPSNMPQAQPIIEMIMQESKSYHRIYIASIHPDLTENDLKSVFKEFGEIVKIQFAKQQGGRGHRGFGYIEFTTQNAVEEALSMNGFDLGGQFLRVGRSITPPDALTFSAPAGPSSLPTASALAAAAVTAKIQAQAMAQTGGALPYD
uniref:Uncharacterized protein n=1 Tax=Acrobeloides nanus TaxID=290746 RepID=A0A914EDE9_9BILA